MRQTTPSTGVQLSLFLFSRDHPSAKDFIHAHEMRNEQKQVGDEREPAEEAETLFPSFFLLVFSLLSRLRSRERGQGSSRSPSPTQGKATGPARPVWQTRRSHPAG